MDACVLCPFADQNMGWGAWVDVVGDPLLTVTWGVGHGWCGCGWYPSAEQNIGCGAWMDVVGASLLERPWGVGQGYMWLVPLC